MRNLANFLLFQIAWFVAVEGAARGAIWAGPVAMAVVVAVHLVLVPDRMRELRFLWFVGIAGTIVDTLLANLGATAYPSSQSAWPAWIVPPWITALWIGFATLPRFSLAWLAHRPWLAALLGAVGGPLSYLAGVRLGAVAVGDVPGLTWGALAAEYALATPLLLRFAPARLNGLHPRGPSARMRMQDGQRSAPGTTSVTVQDHDPAPHRCAARPHSSSS